VKVAAELCWYDERPKAIREYVGAVAPFVDILLALDGSYFHYPGGKAQSPPAQRQALRVACREHGLKLVERRPRKVWASETAKRKAALELAGKLLTPEDWLLRLDTDEIAEGNPDGLRRALARVPHFDVMGVWFHDREPEPHPRPYAYWSRRLVRALPDLTAVDAHFVVRAGSGEGLRYLVPYPGQHRPKADAGEVNPRLLQVYHRPNRTQRRLETKRRYYQTVQDLGLEVLPRPR